MQTHYVFAQSGGMQVPAAVQQLNQSIHNSYAAYLYCLHFISKLAMQQDLEAHIKKNKYLPSTDDLNFIPKFFNNQIIQFLLNNTYFQSRYRREKMQIDDEDEIEPLIEFIIGDCQDKKCHQNRHDHRESKYADSHIIDRKSCYITILYILNPSGIHRTEHDLDKVDNSVCHPENRDDDSESEIIHRSNCRLFPTFAKKRSI